ncbi:alpha/beta fold hydrolase [Psychromicrobium lacuslunae]|uniref:Alpha/beta hydrolase n=1 Tax=Psychromicrobium lacuslunae TaxID=1618207 RepID=A0A0D4BVP0_9MICC|nr:alpha/beta hydrolase [Psychromicrobium lacuslunae]AJT40389.1 alpha/beta hydrolase [Psychromicrobium lacuslunae]
MTDQTISTELLEVSYQVAGPASGHPVLLVHGWPDCRRSWDALLPELHERGFRSYAMDVRGFGNTRFRHHDTKRSGQLVALGQDILDFATALGLESYAVIGHDWGARAGYIAANLDGGKKMTSLTALSVGWGTNDPEQHISLQQAQNYWYHWLMATPRGARLVEQDRESFIRYLWQSWNPGYQVPEPAVEEVIDAAQNPDWAAVTLDSYRSRWGWSVPEERYRETELAMQQNPLIAVPTLLLHGAVDPCNAPQTSAGKEALFTSAYHREVLEKVGHFPQRQVPERVLAALLPFLEETSK